MVPSDDEGITCAWLAHPISSSQHHDVHKQMPLVDHLYGRTQASAETSTTYYEFKPRKSAQQERNVDLVMVTCSRLKHKNIPDLCLRHHIWTDEILTRLVGVFSASRGLGETSLVHGWMNYGSMSCASKRSAFSFPGDQLYLGTSGRTRGLSKT